MHEVGCANCMQDFGLSRVLVDNYYNTDQKKEFPVKWSAPEVINKRKYSEASDVWRYRIDFIQFSLKFPSYGVTCWEVYEMGTGKQKTL